MNTGKALQTWRKRNGLTQEEVAKELGVHVRTYRRWEAGSFPPDANELKQLERRWPGLVMQVLR